MNDRWLDLTGLTLTQTLTDKGALVAIHPDDLEELTGRWTRALLTGSAYEIEYRIRNRVGDYRWHLGRVVPLRNERGDVTRWIAAAFDVHDRRQAEDALRATEAELRQSELALREADHRKDEFLALLSHELRNPLSPIITAAHIMRVRGVATPDEVDVILRQARHVVRLIDDLLDVSRVARGKLTLSKTTVELADVVAKAIEATRPLVEQRRHHLTLSVPSEGLSIEADEVRLTQVVSNLVTNAALYTPQGGKIDVCARRENDEVVIRVRDNGTGIDAARLPSLFEMFEIGARPHDCGHGGLGLGLPLARTLTELHGGTVRAESDGPGLGSEFTVRLPASTPLAHSAPSGRRTHRRATHPRRVLVVDDNVDGAFMTAALLTDAGHEVRVANDPSSALSSIDDFPLQIAIIDVGLPIMDGYTLGRELRARLPDAPLVLIALTGYGQEQDRRRSIEAGFAHHLVKPVDGQQLIDLLDAPVWV